MHNATRAAAKWLGRAVGVLLLSMLHPSSSMASSEWETSSPNGKCGITLSLDADGALSYRVKYEGRPVILRSKLGLVCSEGDFSNGLKFLASSEIGVDRQKYELFTGPKSRVDNVIQRRTVRFKNASGQLFNLEFAASDEGVGFRYCFPEPRPASRTIQDENTTFSLPEGTTGWLTPYHQAGKHTPNNEDYYFPITVGDPPSVSRAPQRGWGMPALLCNAPNGPSLLVLESGDVGEYCGCHLVTGDGKGEFKIAFAHADENYQNLAIDTSPFPTATLPWATPWRVVVLGDPGEILESTLVTDLAPSSRIGDTSWIKPGRSAWGWLTHSEGPYDHAFFDKFSDLAGRYGWEYTTFDGGWWDTDLDAIAVYARDRNVLPLVWAYSGDMCDTHRRRATLDQLKKSGAAGIKVDFWASELQGTQRVIESLLADAADRQLVVLLHGCPMPRGWHRTWPNLLSCEAVLGLEGYLYDEKYPDKVAQLNTVLPFTRNVAGPMDSTPFLLSSLGPQRKTTAVHEVASSIVFSSGVIHYGDKPEIYDALPDDVQSILRESPARWDATECLVGKPGVVIVVARRRSADWYIAGLNGLNEPQEVEIDLTGLQLADRDFTAIVEGSVPSTSFFTSEQKASANWRHTLPPRGGFVLMFRSSLK